MAIVENEKNWGYLVKFLAENVNQVLELVRSLAQRFRVSKASVRAMPRSSGELDCSVAGAEAAAAASHHFVLACPI